MYLLLIKPSASFTALGFMGNASLPVISTYDFSNSVDCVDARGTPPVASRCLAFSNASVSPGVNRKHCSTELRKHVFPTFVIPTMRTGKPHVLLLTSVAGVLPRWTWTSTYGMYEEVASETTSAGGLSGWNAADGKWSECTRRAMESNCATDKRTPEDVAVYTTYAIACDMLTIRGLDHAPQT